MSTEQDLINLRVRVAELEVKLDFLYSKLDIEYINNPGMADARIIDLIKKGNKIEAIKAYRDLTNADLADAKREVEKIEASIL